MGFFQQILQTILYSFKEVLRKVFLTSENNIESFTKYLVHKTLI